MPAVLLWTARRWPCVPHICSLCAHILSPDTYLCFRHHNVILDMTGGKNAFETWQSRMKMAARLGALQPAVSAAVSSATLSEHFFMRCQPSPGCHMASSSVSLSSSLHTKGVFLGTPGGALKPFTPPVKPCTPRDARTGMAARVRPGTSRCRAE